jgi:hypothetical protein
MRTFIDQYNQIHIAKSVKELQSNLGGRCSKMYQDSKDGTIYHIGYVIGSLWCIEYVEKRIKQ